MRTLLLLLSVAVLASAVWAQPTGQSAKKEPMGVVTGHVYCADTNAPARMAHVTLESTRDVADFAPPKEPSSQSVNSPVTFVSTGIDGRFVLPAVKPGVYYLIAEKEGYLSPTQQFTSDELAKPTPEVKERMAKELQKITVEADETASVEVRLERGAAISGAITFDDGSPASGLEVKVLRKDKEGKWKQVALSAMNRGFTGVVKTDDRGNYRLAGLSAGEYIVEADLSISDHKMSNFLGQYFSSMTDTRFTLPFFSGDAMRSRDVALFKLTGGQERSGEDIVIPLTKLHPVSGIVTAAHDGHVVNAAQITLLFADDKTELTSVPLDKTDSTFLFEYVPEGDYILRATGARDVTREEVPYPAGSMPPSYTREKELHGYADAEQPITIHGDTSGVVVSVPEKKDKTIKPPAP